ncbi:MAG TPA: hypothetical protein VGE29_10345, partial [Prosthecobacter sp.]
RECVPRGENGFLVPTKNVDAVVEAMEFFIRQPDQVVRMGRASRLLAEEIFDVKIVNRIITDAMGITGSAPAQPQSFDSPPCPASAGA